MVPEWSIVGRWCFPDDRSPVGRIERADSAAFLADFEKLPIRFDYLGRRAKEERCGGARSAS
jgi:hypothetical protein